MVRFAQKETTVHWVLHTQLCVRLVHLILNSEVRHKPIVCCVLLVLQIVSMELQGANLVASLLQALKVRSYVLVLEKIEHTHQKIRHVDVLQVLISKIQTVLVKVNLVHL
jgi:hypothetical protein